MLDFGAELGSLGIEEWWLSSTAFFSASGRSSLDSRDLVRRCPFLDMDQGSFLHRGGVTLERFSCLALSISFFGVTLLSRLGDDDLPLSPREILGCGATFLTGVTGDAFVCTTSGVGDASRLPEEEDRFSASSFEDRSIFTFGFRSSSSTAS